VSALKVQSGPALTELQQLCVVVQMLHASGVEPTTPFVPPAVGAPPEVALVPPVVVDSPALPLVGERCQ
jgi:hypothetical protein